MAVGAMPAGISGTRGVLDLTQWLALAVVVAVSFVVLSLLGVVLWLGWTTGAPGQPELTYTADNFIEVFTDQRTLTVVIDTLLFSVASLIVALTFGIPAAWIEALIAGRFPDAGTAGTSRKPSGTVIDGYPATAAIDHAAPEVGPTRASSLFSAISLSIPSSRVCFLTLASASKYTLSVRSPRA